MTEKNNMPEQIKDLADAITELGDSEQVQGLSRPLLVRVPKKARSAIYEIGKWLGLIAGASLAVAGVLTGDAERFVAAGAVLLYAVSSFIAKANLTD
jgi:hypothetical protein